MWQITDKGRELRAEFAKMQELVEKFAQFSESVLEEIEDNLSEEGSDAEHLDAFDEPRRVNDLIDEWGYSYNEVSRVLARLLRKELIEEMSTT